MKLHFALHTVTDSLTVFPHLPQYQVFLLIILYRSLFLAFSSATVHQYHLHFQVNSNTSSTTHQVGHRLSSSKVETYSRELQVIDEPSSDLPAHNKPQPPRSLKHSSSIPSPCGIEPTYAESLKSFYRTRSVTSRNAQNISIKVAPDFNIYSQQMNFYGSVIAHSGVTFISGIISRLDRLFLLPSIRPSFYLFPSPQPPTPTPESKSAKRERNTLSTSFPKNGDSHISKTV